MEMLVLLIVMLSFYWLILGCAEIARHFTRVDRGRHQH